jgi:hypothetical protein
MRLRHPSMVFTVPVLGPVLISLPLVLGGCGGDATPTSPSVTSTSNTTLAAGAAQAIAAPPHAFEVVGPIAGSVDQQAEFDRYAGAIDAAYIATDEARDALIASISSQVEQGRIDRAALTPRIDDFNGAIVRELSSNHAALTRFGVTVARPKAAMASSLTVMLRRHLLSGTGLTQDQRRFVRSVRVQAPAMVASYGDPIHPLSRWAHWVTETIDFLDKTVPALTQDQRVAVGRNLRAAYPRVYTSAL